MAKIKNGYRIPDTHNIIRFLKTHLYCDGMTVSPDFWKLKKDEEYLSCLWYEYANKEIEKIKEDIKKLIKGKIEGYLPIQKIKAIQKIANDNKLMNVFVQYQGHNKTSHSGIYNTSNDNLFLSEMAMETSKIIQKQQIKF